MYFDTHAHYDDGKFDVDRQELLAQVHASGVVKIINPGCDLKSSAFARQLAEEYGFIYFAAGIHPEELNDIPEDYLLQLAALAQHPKCVAIGEIGLDYYWDVSRKELQQELFRAQLNLAEELHLPVIVHDREAHGDCFEMVRNYRSSASEEASPGVFHCCSGSVELAQELLKRGWYLGFDGPVTYKNARKTLDVLRITPLDRILIETDSPYLSPVPCRGQRNDSRNLQYVVEKIAEIKGESPEKIEDVTAQNAGRLFRL